MLRPPREFEGEVIERQSFLNGTRSLWIETAGEDDWTAQIALTLPRDEGAPLTEGDVTLAHGESSWFGTLQTGVHAMLEDEATDALVLAVTARYVIDSGAASSKDWTAADVSLRIAGEFVSAEVVIRQ
jgi:hypothetical protein